MSLCYPKANLLKNDYEISIAAEEMHQWDNDMLAFHNYYGAIQG